MTIDISKINPGDKVTLVPLKVANHTSSDGSQVTVHVGGNVVRVGANQIAAHHPAPREFQVGDRVRHADGKIMTVRAVDGSSVWVKVDGGRTNWTVLASDLTLVEGGE